MKLILVITFGILTSIAGNLIAQKYNIDPGHTAITSKAVRFGVVKVVGRFNGVSGSVNYNASDVTKTRADIIVKADSYTANNTAGEDAVKGETFLDVKVYPEIRFVVNSLVKDGGAYKVNGLLTLHGLTKEVSFSVALTGPSLDLPTGKQSLGISGKLIVSRQDFGIKMNRKLANGAEVVSNEIEIEINALAIAE